MKKKNVFTQFLVAGLTVILLLPGCSRDEETPVQEMPYLNKTDSLLMIEIYNKIGPWGYEWNPEDINTWGGVGLALDEAANEYRIVEFNYNGTFREYFPKEICQLTELRKLTLSGGYLTGAIPAEIGNLKNLEWVYIGNNKVYGDIPPEIGQLTNLKRLTIGDNDVSGKIPEEIGNLVNLEWLTIAFCKVEGEIPKSIANLKKLTRLDILKNQLSGEFPVEILAPGRIINCIDNNMTGLSYEVWKDEDDIWLPDLQGNRLFGELPEWVFETEKWKNNSFYVKNQQEGYGYTNFK